MKNYCNPACIYYTNKDYTIESMDIESLEDSLVKRVATDFTQTSFDLADIYDIKGKYTFYPGELVTFMGDTGLGKTAWIQNLCAHIKLNVLYLSLEMSDWLMYRRFCQIASGHDSATVKENMMAKYNGVDVNMPIEYKKLLTWDYNRSLNIMTTRPEVYNIKNIVATHKPHVLVIDHIGFLKSNIHDPRGKISHITGLLKDIAIQQDCIVIAVSHIRRPGENETLNLHMGKESSSIEQDSDKVIGIIGQQNETIRTIKSLKSRDEGYFSANFDVNFDNFRFMQI
jgi:replicative DNA helicase